MEKITNIKPLNGNLIVRDNKTETTTPGGIYIPDSVSPDHIVTGQVISKSPYITEKGIEIDVEVEKNDIIMYSFTAGAGNAWEEEGITYRAIKPVEILAKIVE